MNEPAQLGVERSMHSARMLAYFLQGQLSRAETEALSRWVLPVLSKAEFKIVPLLL
jgi:hypothetical protein